MRRCVLVLAVLAGVVALAGCDVDAKIAINLQPDGSGSIAARVTLDAEALTILEAGGVPLEQRVDFAGFTEAGWQVEEWERLLGGGATVRITHRFSGEEELQALLVDLFGEDGLLSGANIEHSLGVLRNTDGITVDADLGNLSAGVLADSELTDRLRAAGVDPAAIDAQLSQQLDSFEMNVTLIVPRGGQRTFRVAAGEQEVLGLSSTATNYGRIMTIAIAAIVAFLGLLLYLAASISARRRRIVRRSPRRTDAPVY